MTTTSWKQNLAISGFAVAVAELITLPICTVKTIYQTTHATSIKSTIKDLYTHRGVKGFYDASPPAVVGQIVSTSTKYALYRLIESWKLPYSNKATNGMMSGVVSTLMTHPLDVVRVHWQKGVPLKVKKEGFGIFYRGYSKSFAKVICASSLFLPLFDMIKEQNYNPVVASSVSAVISTTAMQPLDYLKTRHIAGNVLFQGWNPRPYYKGLSLNLLRVVPHFVITMTLIDVIQKGCFFKI